MLSRCQLCQVYHIWGLTEIVTLFVLHEIQVKAVAHLLSLYYRYLVGDIYATASLPGVFKVNQMIDGPALPFLQGKY